MTTVRNIIVNQGADFSMNVVVRHSNGAVINLSSYANGYSQARENYTAANATLILDATVADANNGVINISIPRGDTVDVEPGRYLYDVEFLTDSNTVVRVLEGILTISPNFTR